MRDSQLTIDSAELTKFNCLSMHINMQQTFKQLQSALIADHGENLGIFQSELYESMFSLLISLDCCVRRCIRRVASCTLVVYQVNCAVAVNIFYRSFIVLTRLISLLVINLARRQKLISRDSVAAETFDEEEQFKNTDISFDVESSNSLGKSVSLASLKHFDQNTF